VAVDDARWALWLWARDCRRRAEGQLVVVANGPDATTAGDLAGVVVVAAGGSVARPESMDEALAALANVERPDAALLLDLSRLAAGETEQTLEAAQPDVLLTMAAATLPRTLPRRIGRKRIVIACGESGLSRRRESDEEETLSVGRDPRCTWCASRVEQREGRLLLVVEGAPIHVAAWGRHLLEPVLGAYAVGRTLNLEPETIALALADWRPEAPRVAVTNVSGVWLVHGPTGTELATLEKAVAVLRDLPCSGERIAVCNATEQEGGKTVYTPAFWTALAETLVAQGGVDRLVACGSGGGKLASAAMQAGLPAAAIAVTDDVISLCGAIGAQASGGDALICWNLDAPTVGAALTNCERRKAA
jgi:hypothetical protein